jgi:hypothetical protein
MTKRYPAAAVTALAFGLLAAASAFAQIAPSPPWGEPIPDAALRFVVLASYGGEAVHNNSAFIVAFISGFTGTQLKVSLFTRVWCVRGGQGPDVQ